MMMIGDDRDEAKAGVTIAAFSATEAEHLKPCPRARQRYDRRWSSIRKGPNSSPDVGRCRGVAALVKTEALPDFGSGWPGNQLGVGTTAGLDVEKFEHEAA